LCVGQREALLDLKGFETIGTVKTAVSARTRDVDPVPVRIYLAAADGDKCTVAGKSVVPGWLLFLNPSP
jgi:hypothetical protein